MYSKRVLRSNNNLKVIVDWIFSHSENVSSNGLASALAKLNLEYDARESAYERLREEIDDQIYSGSIEADDALEYLYEGDVDRYYITEEKGIMFDDVIILDKNKISFVISFDLKVKISGSFYAYGFRDDDGLPSLSSTGSIVFDDCSLQYELIFNQNKGCFECKLVEEEDFQEAEEEYLKMTRSVAQFPEISHLDIDDMPF